MQLPKYLRLLSGIQRIKLLRQFIVPLYLDVGPMGTYFILVCWAHVHEEGDTGETRWQDKDQIFYFVFSHPVSRVTKSQKIPKDRCPGIWYDYSLSAQSIKLIRFDTSTSTTCQGNRVSEQIWHRMINSCLPYFLEICIREAKVFKVCQPLTVWTFLR